jgi:hypothetical protein
MLPGQSLVGGGAGAATLPVPAAMTQQSHQFPPLPAAASPVSLPPRAARRPNWPRLMNERDAADYLSIGTTLLRDLLPPRKIRGRAVWDIRDLDRFADALSGQPLDQGASESHAQGVEQRWLDGRKQRRGDG